MQRHIAQREYRVSADRQGLQAPNRAHNLRTYFEPTGIRVHDRTAEGSPELLTLRWTGIGRSGRLAAVPTGEVAHEQSHVEIRRAGLVEWYENTPEGLEQGFSLAEPPAGEGALVLELALDGAQVSGAGESLRIAAATGKPFAYSKIAAWDADGAPLAAQMAATAPGQIRIEVDDAGAVYPVTIDPLLTATAEAQFESNQAAAELGYSVSGAGDVNGDGYADVIVGAARYDAGETDEGAAFVFLGSASGIADGNPATAAAQLESDQASAQLGVGVSGAGDVNGDGCADVIVGSSFYDAGETDEGAAFVFFPEPSAFASLLSGITLLGWLNRRRRRPM
jgi:hypothetical protein